MAHRIDDQSYFQTIDKFDSCPCGYLGGFLRTGTLIRMLIKPNVLTDDGARAGAEAPARACG
jgi:hypothetical protein